MRNKYLSVMAAAALVASVGVANAKGPVELKDAQLDNVTAGAAATSQTLLANSTATLNRLVTISNWTLGFLSGNASFLSTP